MGATKVREMKWTKEGMDIIRKLMYMETKKSKINCMENIGLVIVHNVVLVPHN